MSNDTGVHGVGSVIERPGVSDACTGPVQRKKGSDISEPCHVCRTSALSIEQRIVLSIGNLAHWPILPDCRLNLVEVFLGFA